MNWKIYTCCQEKVESVFGLTNMSNISLELRHVEALLHNLSNRSKTTVVVEATLCIFLNISALLLNAFLFWKVYFNDRLRRATNMYVLVLVVLDLLTALVVMPFMCTSGISGRWDFSDILCQFQAYSCVVFAYTTQLMFSLTALNRWFRIFRPRLYATLFAKKYIWLSVVFVFVCSISAPLPYLLQGHKFVFHPGMMLCFYTIDNSREKQAIFRIIFFTILPMIIVTCCYLQIYRAFKKHAKRQESTEDNAAPSMSTTRRIRASQAEARSPCSKMTFEDILMTKILFAMIFAFFVCWTPLYVMTAIDTANDEFSLPRQAYFSATYFVGVSSVANPLIFGCMNAAFRRQCKQMVSPLDLRRFRCY